MYRVPIHPNFLWIFQFYFILLSKNSVWDAKYARFFCAIKDVIFLTMHTSIFTFPLLGGSIYRSRTAISSH